MPSLFPPAPVSRPTPFSAAVSSESKRSGCPINLVNLCRMRAKCQQTKSQVAERPHNLTPTGSTTPPCPSQTYSYSSYSLAAFQNACCVHIKTLLAKWKTPKCKTQNAKAKAKAKAKTSADSCAIQSCCRCQVASSSSSLSL